MELAKLALELWVLGLQAVALMSGNPNYSLETQNSVISQANKFIAIAQEEYVRSSNTSTSTPPITIGQVVAPKVDLPVINKSQEPQVQVLGSVTPTQMKEIVIKDENNNVLGDTVTVSFDKLSLFLNANYKVDGVSLLETVTVSTDEDVTRVFDKSERTCSQSVVGGKKDDCSINYLYRLTSKGNHSVTFTVGETSKVLNVVVE